VGRYISRGAQGGLFDVHEGLSENLTGHT
jgi:hypothetical protein